MLRKLQTLKKKQEGFTIIEVLIVLAIGALILVIVLIAIPQLQRNQRNTARKSLVGRIVTEIGEFSGNNNGSIPVASSGSGVSNFGSPYLNPADGFFKRYMGCSFGAPPVCTTNITDPSTGAPFTVDATQTQAQVVAGVDYPDEVGEIGYYTGSKCQGELVVSAGASARNYAVATYLEGGAISCLPAE